MHTLRNKIIGVYMYEYMYVCVWLYEQINTTTFAAYLCAINAN